MVTIPADRNIAVDYVDAFGRVHKPHLLWLIENSVAFTRKGKKPLQWSFTKVLRRLTAALMPHGADPGGLSNPRRMKNPLCPAWGREIFAAKPYDLTRLRQHTDHVDGGNLKAPPPSARPWLPDHPDAAIAVQSNHLFQRLRRFARDQVVQCPETGRFEELRDAVEEEACQLCRGLNGDRGDRRKAEKQALRIARSVAKWTWDNQDWLRKQACRIKLTKAEVRTRQAAAGKAAAAARGKTTAATILAAAESWVSQHARWPTQADLVAVTDKGERTIRRYWPFVLSRLSDLSRLSQLSGAEIDASRPATRPPIDKKGPDACDTLITNADALYKLLRIRTQTLYIKLLRTRTQTLYIKLLPFLRLTRPQLARSWLSHWLPPHPTN